MSYVKEEKAEKAIDKRNARRVKRELFCYMKDLDAGTPSMPLESYIHDISETGLRFRACKFIPLHHRLSFTIELPKRRSIEVTAAPAWVSEFRNLQLYNVGVTFSNIAPPDRALLKEFLNV